MIDFLFQHKNRKTWHILGSSLPNYPPFLSALSFQKTPQFQCWLTAKPSKSESTKTPLYQNKIAELTAVVKANLPGIGISKPHLYQKLDQNDPKEIDLLFSTGRGIALFQYDPAAIEGRPCWRLFFETAVSVFGRTDEWEEGLKPNPVNRIRWPRLERKCGRDRDRWQ